MSNNGLRKKKPTPPRREMQERLADAADRRWLHGGPQFAGREHLGLYLQELGV